MKRLILAAMLIATPAMAQLRPTPGPGDPRLQTVAYDATQVVQLQVATGYQLAIEFAPDERIENVAVGDSGAWQVTPNKRGDHLFVKALSSSATTNMTVVTDARVYAFELVPMYGAMPDMAFIVRFTYPEAVTVTVIEAAPVAPGRYRLSGAKALRPSALHDDGARTYIEWPAEATLPAVFAIDEQGEELLVDGYMRDGRYTIDAVKPKLVFRLDKQIARADRIAPRDRN